MKYVSIDIETTGLDPAKHQIREIGAVAVDGTKRIGTFRALIIPGDMNGIIVSPYTALLHTRLWEELQAFSKRHYGPCMTYVQDKGFVKTEGECHCAEAGTQLREWLEYCGFAKANERLKITVAGKNVASFDIPFLKAHTDIEQALDIRHRVLDVAPCFMLREDECLPDLNTCLQRAGIEKKTSHGALDDALLICDLIDFIFNKQLTATA